MDLPHFRTFTFDSTGEAIAATCPIPGEPAFESARRAIVASVYLGKDDSTQPRLTALSADTLAELIANIRRVIGIIGEYVEFQPDREDGSENEPELWEEEEVLASYGAQLAQFLVRLAELSA